MNHQKQREAAKYFSEVWKNKGYEKGDSHSFWISLLNEVYGIEHPTEFISFEDKVQLDHTSFIDGYIPSTHVLIEQKSIDKDLSKAIRQSDGTLLSPFQQAKRYSSELPYSERPRWIVTCNFKEFNIYDMEKPIGDPEIVLLSELEKDYYRMFFLIDEGDENIQKEIEVSLKAGELIGEIYEALLKEYINPKDEQTLKDLNILCVRLVFCFYAEDAGIFDRHGLFHDYLMKYNSFNFRDALINVFRVLDQKPDERDPYIEEDLAAFPYVNGGLFSNEQVVIPKISNEIIDIILDKASANFDWSNISPTIFGGVFESTLNPETRRSGGMHYTSIKNIHKVIDPLFMNELNEEFENIKSIKIEKTRNRKLAAFQEKIASLTFLDPAAGSGNFLTETYLSLRRLENRIIGLLYGGQIIMEEALNPIKVSIKQFYGIEINDFAVTVGKTALWIAESQMLKETEDIINMSLEFLPLKSYTNIIEGNSLIIDWEDVVSIQELNYIMGNPPFVGSKYSNNSQKKDMEIVFGNINKNYKKLDYVSSWFLKSALIMNKNSKISTALVSTNSIYQGEQVSILWDILLNLNIKINFAYTTFIWKNEARNYAAVHCAIAGFDMLEHDKKYIFNNGSIKLANNISPYIVDAPNIVVKSRSKPISDRLPMMAPNKPCDYNNLKIENDEYEEFITKCPKSKKWIKKMVGAYEFINKKNRYCLWLVNCPPNELRLMPEVLDRVEKCKKARIKAGTKESLKLALTPTLFREQMNPDKYLLIPAVSSERRKYIPIGFLDINTIPVMGTLIIPNATLFDFGILTSNVHMSWVKTVAGRLKSDYRYSKNIVYNTFPLPNPKNTQINKIRLTSQAILDARKKYSDSNLADLYDELTMPPELRKAHQENDKAVMEAYGFDWKNMNESECVAELMKMYKELAK